MAVARPTSERWVTMRGRRVLIKAGQTSEAALKESLGEKKEGGISTTLKSLLGEYLGMTHLGAPKSAEEVNNGECAAIAAKCVARVKGAKFEAAGSGFEGYHVWVSLKGRHYDVERPDGVKDPKDLPFFKRNPELYKDRRSGKTNPLYG